MMPDHVPERIAPVGARRVGFVEHRGRLAIAVELPANLFQPAALHRLTKLLALRLPPCDRAARHFQSENDVTDKTKWCRG